MRSWAAVILAAGAALSILVLSVAAGWAEAHKGLAISAEASTLLSTALGAAIGAVAAYIGVRASNGGPE